MVRAYVGMAGDQSDKLADGVGLRPGRVPPPVLRVVELTAGMSEVGRYTEPLRVVRLACEARNQRISEDSWRVALRERWGSFGWEGMREEGGWERLSGE